MKRTLKWTLLLTLAAGAVLYTACTGGHTEEEGPEAVEMQVYKVPAAQSDQVRSMLRSALGGEIPVGRVTNGPGNTLVVVAPARVHKGVRGLIDELADVDATPDLLQVTASYWMIVGRPLEQAPADGRGYVVAGDSTLAAVESALETIVGVQGPTEFALVEQVRLTALNSDMAIAQGRVTRVEQRITAVGDRITGQVSFRMGGNSLSTRVMLDPGQLLVLGQAGFDGRTGDVFNTGGSREMTLYYVMTGQL